MHGGLGRREAADHQGHEAVLRVRRDCVFQRKQDLLQAQEISAEGEMMEADIVCAIIAFAIWGIMCFVDSRIGRYPYGRTMSTSA
jgi:hypothetical protein